MSKRYRGRQGPVTCDVCEEPLTEARVVNDAGDLECVDCGAITEGEVVYL